MNTVETNPEIARKNRLAVEQQSEFGEQQLANLLAQRKHNKAQLQALFDDVVARCSLGEASLNQLIASCEAKTELASQLAAQLAQPSRDPALPEAVQTLLADQAEVFNMQQLNEQYNLLRGLRDLFGSINQSAETGYQWVD